MSIFAGPNIVKDNLAMYLDAGNSDSYPGSGSTWYDLSGNGLDATLTVAPTYDSNGYFSFDGVDDYMTANSGLQTSIQNASEYTAFAWAYVTKITHVSNIIGWGNANASGGVVRTWGFYSYSGTIRNMYYPFTNNVYGNVATLGNRWVLFVSRLTATEATTDTYGGYEVHNGPSLIPAAATWKNIPTVYPIKMGKISYSDSTTYMTTMLLGSIMCYDRYLSNDEVKQTYAATRGRYGL